MGFTFVIVVYYFLINKPSTTYDFLPSFTFDSENLKFTAPFALHLNPEAYTESINS